MLRKIMMLAALALTFFTATAGSFAQDPIPECNPCPWEWGEKPPAR